MSKRILLNFLGAILLMMPFQAEAGTILAPTSVIANTMGNCCSYQIGRTIDQSGLSSTYISGSDDFDTYIAGNPTHDNSLTSNSTWYGISGQTTGFVDYDLGQEYSIERLAFWGVLNSNASKDFTVFTSLNSSFSGATNVGSFSSVVGFPLSSAMVIDLADTVGRYLRLQITAGHGGSYAGFSEIALDVNGGTPDTVPVPGTLALLGFGLLGLSMRRRAA